MKSEDFNTRLTLKVTYWSVATTDKDFESQDPQNTSTACAMTKPSPDSTSGRHIVGREMNTVRVALSLKVKSINGYQLCSRPSRKLTKENSQHFRVSLPPLSRPSIPFPVIIQSPQKRNYHPRFNNYDDFVSCSPYALFAYLNSKRARFYNYFFFLLSSTWKVFFLRIFRHFQEEENRGFSASVQALINGFEKSFS